MKTLPFGWENSMGFRFYEGEDVVGYISLNIDDTRCETCGERDCDWCNFDEQADYVEYRITSTYPLDGFEKKSFTDCRQEEHVYYSKKFKDPIEAAKRFMKESQKLIK